MEEQSLSNALFVMLSLHEVPTWVDTWHQTMKVTSLSNVTIVMPVHEGTKPFKCDTCDAGFTSKQGLEGHVVSIHGGTKSFKCTICDAIFAPNTHLSGHMASIHEGKKPFKCNICDASS